MNNLLNGVADLTHLGVIRVEGDDAAKFLHGQLTQDFSLLGMSEARLSAFCNAKGRMQASFIGFKRSPTEIVLICSRDLLPATLKRLTMFVMRAKAKLSDASAEFQIHGAAGDAIKTIAELPLKAWAKLDLGVSNWIRLYSADGVPRGLRLAPISDSAPQGDVLPLPLWLWSEVRSGVATLTTPVFEAFVPQMLNYESIGGVNFKKGCYPGQEVVARSQFRGTLKRRTYLAHCDAEPNVGQEVFDSPDPTQPCGTVVQAAACPAGGFDTLISMQISAASAQSICLGAVDGPSVTLLPLPYPLLDDI